MIPPFVVRHLGQRFTIPRSEKFVAPATFERHDATRYGIERLTVLHLYKVTAADQHGPTEAIYA